MNVNMFQFDMNINEPHGIIYPLLKENYAWIDKYLQEKFYNNIDKFYNFDKCLEKELLNEQYDYELVNHELEENYISLLKPTPITWANYKSRTILKCLEDEEPDSFITSENHKRSDSNMSNYEVNVGKVILNAYSNSLCNNYNLDYFEEFSTKNFSHKNQNQKSEESYYSYGSY
jgi:hypothetical protein